MFPHGIIFDIFLVSFMQTIILYRSLLEFAQTLLVQLYLVFVYNNSLMMLHYLLGMLSFVSSESWLVRFVF